MSERSEAAEVGTSDQQVYANAIAIVDVRGIHDPTWTEKSFIGEHFTVTRFVDQITIEVPKDNNPHDREVVFKGDGKSVSISKLSPETVEKLQGAAEIVAEREDAPESDSEREEQEEEAYR